MNPLCKRSPQTNESVPSCCRVPGSKKEWLCLLTHCQHPNALSQLTLLNRLSPCHFLQCCLIYFSILLATIWKVNCPKFRRWWKLPLKSQDLQCFFYLYQLDFIGFHQNRTQVRCRRGLVDSINTRGIKWPMRMSRGWSNTGQCTAALSSSILGLVWLLLIAAKMHLPPLIVAMGRD